MTDAVPAGLPERPVTLLIAALGGEGGGILTDWIVAAAMGADYPVQSTSIPGVAQRTGATTYYVEVYPLTTAALGGREPVMSLYPSPGDVDVMIASELIEAGRAIENGFVSPDRTTLIASTHRIYAIAEKSAMADGIHDGDRVLDAAGAMARRTVMSDLAALAKAHDSALNAVLLGIVAGIDALPISARVFEQAIRDRGIGVEASLRGFAAGLAAARGELEPPVPEPPPARSWSGRAVTIGDVLGRLGDTFPAQIQDLMVEGAKRAADYQDATYAQSYLDRLVPVLAVDRKEGGAVRDYGLTRETARFLALWMSYEDVIRVADLKTRAARTDRVRKEVGAGPDEPVQVTEFLKPGVEEITAILPRGLGRSILHWAERRGLKYRLQMSMRIRTHTLFGFLLLWSLGRLRRIRRRSFRFAEEQALIERWLSAVQTAAKHDYELALEIAECANLNKGYGETHARGRGNFLRILDEVITPALANGAAIGGAAAAVGRAREAALSDPEGDTLRDLLTELSSVVSPSSGEPAAKISSQKDAAETG